MRMRKKKNLLPLMDACGALLVRDPQTERGCWRERKPGAIRLRLELGSGKGRFTAETAAAHPDDLYVAVERVPDAMVIAMERCRALVAEHTEQAKRSVEGAFGRPEFLCALADSLAKRKN